jgi:hypothetical protein
VDAMAGAVYTTAGFALFFLDLIAADSTGILPATR